MDVYVCMCAKLLELCLTLCNPMDCSLSGSPIHGILQVRILEWVAMSSSRALPDSGIEPASLMSLASADGFFTTSATWDAMCLCSFCPTGAVPLHFFLGSQRSPTERKDETLLKGKKKWAPKTM